MIEREDWRRSVFHSRVLMDRNSGKNLRVQWNISEELIQRKLMVGELENELNYSLEFDREKIEEVVPAFHNCFECSVKVMTHDYWGWFHLRMDDDRKYLK